VLNGGQDPLWEGALLGGHVQAHGNVPMHECIAHRSPAATKNEWTNTLATAIGDKTTMRPFVKFLRSLPTPRRKSLTRPPTSSYCADALAFPSTTWSLLFILWFLY